MEWEINDDQNSDEQISSVKILPTVFVPNTDGLNLSIKLFNGVVVQNQTNGWKGGDGGVGKKKKDP